MTKKSILSVGLIAVVAIIIAIVALRPAPSSDQDSLNFRLKWVFYSSFAHHFAAEESGAFAEEDIAVNMRAGGAGLDPLRLVASGEDDIGLASYGQILMACERGLPLVAIGESNIASGVVFISLAESGITEPSQFLGKKVGVIPGSDTGSVYEAVMAKLDLDRGSIDEVPIGFSVDPLLNGSIDVSTAAFSTNQPLFIESQGIGVNVIDPKDYDIEVGGNVFFVRRAFLDENKELLRRFLRADLKGTERALTMTDEEVVDLVLSYNDVLDRDAELDIWRATKAVLLPSNMDDIGVMPDQMWQRTNDVFSASGLTSADLDISQCYTNELVTDLFDE